MIVSLSIALIFDILSAPFGLGELPEFNLYMPPWETFATKALSASEKESDALAAIADARIRTATLPNMGGVFIMIIPIFEA
jgi:hypothetical protein